METLQQMDLRRVHQQRVRQAGINESRAAAVGSPVGVGVSPTGPELQMFMGPVSPELPPVHPQWGMGHPLGGAPQQAMGGHQGGAVEWQAQMQTVVQGGGGAGGAPGMAGSLGGGQQFVQMGAVYTSAHTQATPWGGQPFAQDAFRAAGFEGPVQQWQHQQQQQQPPHLPQAYGRPMEEAPGMLILPGMNPMEDMANDQAFMQYGGGPGLGEPGHGLPPLGVPPSRATSGTGEPVCGGQQARGAGHDTDGPGV